MNLQVAINSLYGGHVHPHCCEGERYELSGNLPELVAELRRIAKALYSKAKPSGKDMTTLQQQQYGALREAVAEGTGKMAYQVKLGEPNHEMLKNLQTNLGVFSAFKVHSAITELTRQLIDEDGNLKPYYKFQKDVMDLYSNTYNKDYLKTEYNAAVRSSRMATKWQEVQRTKRLYPNLEYIRSRSADKRVDHEKLVGTILPVDHPFWDKHFPPNGWNCKCSVRPTKAQATEEPAGVTIDPTFAFNPGKDGQVFDMATHPYSKVPQEAFQEAMKLAQRSTFDYERKEAYERAKKNTIGKKVEKEELDYPVEFCKASITNPLEGGDAFFAKLAIVSDLVQVMQKAEYSATAPARDGSKPDVKQFHYYSVEVEGHTYKISLKETTDKHIYVYDVKLVKK